MAEMFVLPPALDLGGASSRLEKNLTALETLQRLNGAAPTLEEALILAQYSGWGDTQVRRGIIDYDGEVKPCAAELIPAEDLEALKKSVLSAFYTPLPVIRAIWAGLMRLGVGKLEAPLILEPSMGVGHFIGAAPQEIRQRARFVGVELDRLTARIATALYPEATIKSCGFEEAILPQNTFDVVVGNVPFGDFGVSDPNFRPRFLTRRIHDYFIAKSMTLLRPHGVLALITSAHTLDKKSKMVREWLAEHGELLGAMRLPSTTFSASAGTEVVTDVLFLRRLPEGAPRALTWTEAAWIKKSLPTERGWMQESPIHLNRYYVKNPKQIVGELGLRHGKHGDEVTVRPRKDGTLEAHMARALEVLPKNVMTPQAPGAAPAPVFADEPRPDVNAPAAAKAPELWAVYLAARELLALQAAEAADEEEIEEARAKLNTLYAAARAKFKGPLARRGRNKAPADVLRGLPIYQFLQALEEPGGAPAAIFRERTTRAAIMPGALTISSNALYVCLDRRGAVDMDWIAATVGRPREVVEAELAGQVFCTPDGAWVTADEYLSGNLGKKLREAEAKLPFDPKMAENVAALRKALPPPIPAGDIHVRLGAGWIPEDVVTEFVAHLIPSTVSSYYTLSVRYIETTAEWLMEGFSYEAQRCLENTQKWGTPRRGALDLILDCLNSKLPVIYDSVEEVINGETKTRQVRNNDETLLAQGKQQDIKDAWEAWVWKDAARADRVAKIYNERFNQFRVRHFTGQHLTFPGLSEGFTPYASQLAAVARGLTASQDNPAFIHEVGAGKTASGIMTAVKSVQLGLIRRALLVVPNHLIGQWGAEFARRYPGELDRLVVAAKESFTKEHRATFLASIATGNAAYVVITYEQFKALPLSDKLLDKALERELEELQQEREILDIEDSYSRADKLAKRRLDMAFKQRQAALEKYRVAFKDRAAAATREDKTVVTFEDLGVDLLLFDECFPYHTPVITDRGLVDIGEIVEKRLSVKVLSHKSGKMEWKPVVNWWKRRRTHTMVKVIHEGGSFICTADHKVWTDGAGYVHAQDLTSDHFLTFQNLQALKKECTTKHVDGYEDVRGVRGAVQLPVSGEVECPAPLLRQLMCGHLAHEATGPDGPVHGGGEGTPACAHGGRALGALEAHAPGQPNERRRDSGEDAGQDDGADLPVPGRELEDHASAGDIGGGAGLAYGSGNLHGASEGVLQVSAELLQGGHRSYGVDDRGGGGREESQDAEVAILGQKEGGSAVLSRVVRVEVLESGDPDLIAACGGESESVYDLEVEDNHNYFAAGVLVSNCQALKNDWVATKMTNVAGLARSESQRAFDARLKIHYLLGRKARVIFLTGTPITNTVAECFVMMRYLQPDMLREMGIYHFDAWAATFGEVYASVEMDNLGGFRTVSRLRYGNLPELMALLGQSWDRATVPDALRPKLAGGQMIVIKVPGSEALRKHNRSLARRMELIRARKVDPAVDNALLVTRDGRDGALFNGPRELGFVPGVWTKVDALAERVKHFYEAYAADKAAQLVFCDLFTPRGRGEISAEDGEGDDEKPILPSDLAVEGVYGVIRRKLVAAGVPDSEIAYIHTAKTPAAKEALFAAVRAGEVRVLIGSTAKMGTGMNVQERLIALHHLDCPWRPADLEQRVGRIQRQGNMYKEVHVFAYVTEGSYDPVNWQFIELKAKFIRQIMAGEVGSRTADDVGDLILNYALVKAIALGDARIIDRVKLETELLTLSKQYRGWVSEQVEMRRTVQFLPAYIAEAEMAIAKLEALQAALDRTAGQAFSMTVWSFRRQEMVKVDSRAAANDLFLELLQGWNAGRDRVESQIPKVIGTWRGLSLMFTGFAVTAAHRMGGYISGQVGPDTVRSMTYSVNRIAGQIEEERANLDRGKARAATAEKYLDHPWIHEARARAALAHYEELCEKTPALGSGQVFSFPGLN